MPLAATLPPLNRSAAPSSVRRPGSVATAHHAAPATSTASTASVAPSQPSARSAREPRAVACRDAFGRSAMAAQNATAIATCSLNRCTS